MLQWIIILAVVSVIAGALGFRTASNVSARLALLLGAILIGLVAIVLLLFYWAGGGLV